jgi:hypothetical protein
MNSMTITSRRRRERREWMTPRPRPSARLFDLPDDHPDRMLAASIVLYVGLGIIIAVAVWNHWNVAHPWRRGVLA